MIKPLKSRKNAHILQHFPIPVRIHIRKGVVATEITLSVNETLEDIYHRHVDMLYRVAYSFMKNNADAEDMVQETFIRLLRSGPVFDTPQHEKAWLIVTISNLCKSALRSPWRRRESIEELTHPPAAEDTPPDETLSAVLALPTQDRVTVYLYYYEGYQTAEIARMLDIPPATVRSRLARARKKLKLTLGGDAV